MSRNGDELIVLDDLWKVFGDDAAAIGAVVRDRLSKTEAMARYGCVAAVAGVSLTIRRGEIFCVMGLSGSGKSTLVRHINRLIEPSAGRILIDDSDVSAMAMPALRRLRNERVGMVFQNMALLPHRTVRDNVALGLELRGQGREARWARADAMLDVVQLDGWGDRYTGELSGGMQQRVGLARALATDPEILLMDEPFSALDPLIRRQLQDQFLDLSARFHKTTVFITHDLDEAIRLGDRIAIMKDGLVIQVGTPEAIVLNPADDYVAAFVHGISRLELVSAGTIMTPLGSTTPPDSAPRVDVAADLDRLIDVAVETDLPVVVEQAGRPVGTISKEILLRALQGHRGPS
ncbi:MAG: betaine/proline/choline family ABC transporter ATP-binding protein [Alphaproteobacteria bacterium]|nr:betaine/proline/choline family ABC transporter ATP-binding protein [Alphaproteobacteria bacterium]